jgi:hypothetical protein
MPTFIPVKRDSLRRNRGVETQRSRQGSHPACPVGQCLTPSDVRILRLSIVDRPVMLCDGRIIKRVLADVEGSCDNCAAGTKDLSCPLQGACCPKGALMYIFVEVKP